MSNLAHYLLALASVPALALLWLVITHLARSPDTREEPADPAGCGICGCGAARTCPRKEETP